MPLTGTSLHLLRLARKCGLFPATTYLPSILVLPLLPTFLRSCNRALPRWVGLKTLSGETNKYGPPSTRHAPCLRLSVCISLPSGSLLLVSFLRASISRSQWERFFLKRGTVLSWYHQTTNSEQSKADFRALLSKLAWDFPRVGVQCSILGES